MILVKEMNKAAQKHPNCKNGRRIFKPRNTIHGQVFLDCLELVAMALVLLSPSDLLLQIHFIRLPDGSVREPQKAQCSLEDLRLRWQLRHLSWRVRDDYGMHKRLNNLWNTIVVLLCAIIH